MQIKQRPHNLETSVKGIKNSWKEDGLSTFDMAQQFSAQSAHKPQAELGLSYHKQMTQVSNHYGTDFLKIQQVSSGRRSSFTKNGAANRIDQLSLKKEIDNDLDALSKLFQNQNSDELFQAVSPENSKRKYGSTSKNKSRAKDEKW